jgi:hypothetical protein
MWMDSDVWVSPLWLGTSLDMFLQAVPPEKHFVHGNYRSMTTGVFFVRQSEEGRMLLLEWLGAAASGQVRISVSAVWLAETPSSLVSWNLGV